jgi:hypothetical protein
MLPKVLKDKQVQGFKFWFSGALHDGLHYRHELFYRILTVQSGQRPRLFHLGCRLCQNGGQALITVSAHQSSLWISLRSQVVLSQIKANPVQGLPNLQL